MAEVSRETEQRPPQQLLDRLFASRLPIIESYVALLATRGVERGLLGPREAPRLWSRHILNCAVLSDLVPTGSALADLGSGAGLPGCVLAIARPDVHVTLIEPLLRRSVFLLEVRESLHLDNVEVVRARADEVRRPTAFDLVTARAVAPLHMLVQWALPLCRAGGELVAVKGKSASAELRRARPVMRQLDAGPVSIEQLGTGVLEVATTVVRIQSNGQRSSGRRGSS